ncbi:MAG: hypothetical protein NTY77_03775 [Elusimicrobia bacterium]|nr:hypothetical protein [Elusimicrobiota bacterium]
MDTRQEAQIAEALAAMKEAEQAVADFYTACAKFCPGNGDLWLDLAQQEQRHARIAARMGEIFASRPEDFQPGRPFNAVAIRTFIKGVKCSQERALKGELQQRQLIGVARDIESSIIESRFSGIVQTEDQEFLELMRQLLDETADHHDMLDELPKDRP